MASCVMAPYLAAMTCTLDLSTRLPAITAWLPPIIYPCKLTIFYSWHVSGSELKPTVCGMTCADELESFPGRRKKNKKKNVYTGLDRKLHCLEKLIWTDPVWYCHYPGGVQLVFCWHVSVYNRRSSSKAWVWLMVALWSAVPQLDEGVL